MEDLEKTAEDIKIFFDLDYDGVQFVFNLNFLGTLLPTQVFAKDMVKSGKGGCLKSPTKIEDESPRFFCKKWLKP